MIGATLSIEAKLEALRLVCHAQRFTQGEATRRQQGALIGRFDEALGSRDRVLRLCVVSALLGRPVTSFKQLFGGEIRAMLDESDLDEILEFLQKEVRPQS